MDDDPAGASNTGVRSESSLDVREMPALAGRHDIGTVVDVMPLAQADTAIDKVRAGRPATAWSCRPDRPQRLFIHEERSRSIALPKTSSSPVLIAPRSESTGPTNTGGRANSSPLAESSGRTGDPLAAGLEKDAAGRTGGAGGVEA
jgi:hypothetical protein